MITETHKKELANLLDSCNPSELRKTIQFLYFSFTMDKNNIGLLPENFDEMSKDVFFLLEFIEHLELNTSQKK